MSLSTPQTLTKSANTRKNERNTYLFSAVAYPDMESRDPPKAGGNRRPSLPPSTNSTTSPALASSSQTIRSQFTPKSQTSSEEPLTKAMATHKSFDSTKSSSRGSRDSLTAKAPTRKPSQEASTPPPPNPNDQAWHLTTLCVLSRHITDV